jgi:hypothetical protein
MMQQRMRTCLSYLAFWRPPAERRSLVSRKMLLSLALIPSFLMLGVGAGPASADTIAPGWAIHSAATPGSLSTSPAVACPGNQTEYCQGFFVTATNVGTEPSGTVVIHDTLPDDVSVITVPRGLAKSYNPDLPPGELEEGVQCGATSSTTVTCSYGQPLPPGGIIQFMIYVSVSPQAGASVTNHAEIEEPTGPGTARAVTVQPSTLPTPVDSGPQGFGVTDFSVGAFSADGEPDNLAGSHPASVLTSISYNTRLIVDEETEPYQQVQEPKVENVDLPMGFIGDALTTPHCSDADALDERCPLDTRVGVVGLFKGEGRESEALGIYNMAPEPGYPAQFAFTFLKTLVTLRPRVLPTRSGYVLSVPVPAVPRSEVEKFHEVSVMFFGDPSLQDGGSTGEAFATNPDDCSAGPLDARLEMNAWVEPENWQSAEAAMFQAGNSQGVTGCDALHFNPTVQVTPETTQADTPSGYEVDVRVPQAPNYEGDLETPDLKDAVLTLPEGISVAPGAANGLLACPATGPEAIDLGNNDLLVDENLAEEGEEIGADGVVHPAPGHCPAASQIGTVEVITPLLEKPLTGHVYVAEPQCGSAGQTQCTPQSAEDGQLFGIYLEIAGSGIVVKLKGNVSVNPQTGRLTTRFTETPQLPFSELKLKLDGGSRSPLANPQSCSTATAVSDLTPWSTPYTPDATPFSSFLVTGCTGGFAPAFAAGMVATLHAGSYSPFTLTFSRHDGEQDLSGLTVNMPEGLIGKIAGFPQCENGEVAAAENNTGGCTAASKVGTATAGAGAGATPFYQSGNVYLTGPYNGAPFGLAVVVPANAGPFHLGNIVVRAAIHINPTTAQVTVVSNPLPQMIDGVPLRVKTVNVTVGQEGNFTFNPTNCEPESIGATITSAQGTNAGVSAPFAATGCKDLKFAPVFSATAMGKASKAGGASLDVKVAYPSGPLGTYANVAKVKVALPKQLPSRLTTLQKACTAAQFAENPAGCPVASNIGTAIARTPALSNPLSGPAYLVSHGGEAFPQLEIVLQGEGVVFDLIGDTNIKKGITTSTFNTVPDVPVSGFELKLPTGMFSVLSANVPEKDHYNFCGQKLSMPTEITAQNGAVIKQTTKVAIAGCPKAKAKGKAAKKKKPTKSSRRAK